MNIRDLKGLYSGECAILANGPSLVKRPLKEIPLPGLDGSDIQPLWAPADAYQRDVLAYPLWEIPVPTFTMNRSWMLTWPTVGHVIAEEYHQKMHPAVYARLAREERLFTVGGAWPNEAFKHAGYNVKIASDRLWSQDVAQNGVVVCLGICGTVTLVAMQIAAYLGFTKLWMLGLDLSGKTKFSGHGVGKLEGQRELFRMAAPEIERAGVEVVVVGQDSACDAFPKKDWPWGLTA